MNQKNSTKNNDSTMLDNEAILEDIQGGTGDLNVNAHVHGTPTLSSYFFRTTRKFTISNGDLNIDSNIS